MTIDPGAKQDLKPWTKFTKSEDIPDWVANAYIETFDFGGANPLRLVRSPIQYNETTVPLVRAPESASNTEELLLKLGLTWDDITGLKSQQVIT